MTNVIAEDYKEVLERAARAPTAAFQLFITSPERSREVYLFCEGEDDILFYVSIVSLAGYSAVTPLDCGNRHGVLTVYKMIAERSIGRADYLCFYDSDFEPFIPRDLVNGPRLFHTSGYSVENYFQIAEVLPIFLRHISGIVWDGALTSALIAASLAKFEKFCRIHLVISAYAICEIRRGSGNPLSEISFDSIFRSEKGNIVFNRDNLPNMKRIFARRHDAEYRDVIFELRNQPAAKYVRGKYHIRMIWLLLRVVYNVIRARYPTSPISGRLVRVPDSTRGTSFFENMSARIAVPQDLAAFLIAHPPV